MLWNKLPPKNPDECRFRSGVEGGGEFAVCELVRDALPGVSPADCRVPRATCCACCQAFPATPASWNPVVASLVFRAASSGLTGGLALEKDAKRVALARKRALDELSVARVPPLTAQPQVPHFENLAELLRPLAKRNAAKINKWAVGVTTSPRRTPTLDLCLASLTRAGWDSPHLFMDSAVRVSGEFGALPGTLRTPAIGAWPNHYLALLELTLRYPNADAYLMMQDDAQIYDGENVREYLEGTLWPEGPWPLMSLYCPAAYSSRKYGWRRRRWPWVWGALAFVFPRDVAFRYLRDRLVCRHRWKHRRNSLVQIDVVLGLWAFLRRIPVWFPSPSLIQHIGETSTLSAHATSTEHRAAGLFAGNKAGVSQPRSPETRCE